MRKLVVGLLTAAAMVVVIAYRVSAFGSGGPGTYRFMETQPGDPSTPVTYSSCKPIRVEINTAGVEDEAWARSLILAAMGEVSAATHLSLVYVGESTAKVQIPTPPLTVVGGERPVLVGFATPLEIPSLRGYAGRGEARGWSTVAGRRGSRARQRSTPRSSTRCTTGRAAPPWRRPSSCTSSATSSGSTTSTTAAS